MKIRPSAPVLLLLSIAAASPLVAQGIPDEIPDEPGESLAERERERLEERYRGTLSRFFTGGAFDIAPVNGPSYQANLDLGLYLDEGDALLLSFAARTVPPAPDSRTASLDMNEGVLYFGAGVELNGTRFLGASPVGRRSALGIGMGVLHGSDASTIALNIAPTYVLFYGTSWSVPVGVRLSLAAIGNESTTVTRAFVGFNLGLRLHWAQRDRLDTR